MRVLLLSLLVVLCCLGTGLASVQPAIAQGFMVKPMRLEAAPRAGDALELPIYIRNTDGSGSRPIDVRLVELSQNLTGSWRLMEQSDGDVPAGHASALAWTSLAQARVEIGALEPAQVIVRVVPPASAKGTYFVGIVAETPAPENAPGVTVRTRFLIPLIVQIQGRAVRQKVSLADVVLLDDVHAAGTENTKGGLRIVNAGQTFSRVRGVLQIERQDGDRWRTVTKVPIPERGIIPGMTLELVEDLGRDLPSGQYRLHGELFVDGRRTAPLEQIREFVGKQGVDLAYDATMLLDPPVVDMPVVPGATRTTTLTVTNTSPDPVSVKLSAITPPGLAGVELGSLRGTDLSAEPWTSIRPAEFVIRGNGRQNVRVISAVPENGLTHANYYAELLLTGSYSDGQSAGETRSMVHLTNSGVDAQFDGMIETLSMSVDEGGKYLAQLRFANIGNVDVLPKVRVALLTAQGIEVRSAALSGDEGALLPLGKRTFSGEIDLTGLEPGMYALRSTARLSDDHEVARQYVVNVEFGPSDDADMPGDVPRVTFIDPAAALELQQDDTREVESR